MVLRKINSWALLALVLALAVFVTACSGNGTLSNVASPSSTASGATSATPVVDPGAPEGATVPPTPPSPGANATTPQYTLTGSPYGGCVNVTQGMSLQQWLMKVSDAGPRQFHVVAFAQQDPDPGCGATTREARPRLSVDGVYDYTPHSSGQTTFSFNPAMYTCGHVQVDASIIDDITKQDTGLILSSVFNYGTKCTPPPPVAPTCSAVTSSLVKNSEVLSASMLDGEYTPTFSGPAGTTASLTVNGEALTFTSGVRKTIALARPNPGEPSRVATVVLTPKVGETSCEAKSITFTAPPKEAPSVCTLTATAVWDQSHLPNPAVKYRLSVTPSDNRQVMVGFNIDGNTQNPSPVDLNTDMYFAFIQDPREHAWSLNAAYSHSNGATCTVRAAVTIPPAPGCTLQPIFSLVSGGVIELGTSSLTDEESNFQTSGSTGVTPSVTVKATVDVQNYPTANAVAIYWMNGQEWVKIGQPVSASCPDGKKRISLEFNSTERAHLPSKGARYKVILYTGSTTHGTIVPSPIASIPLNY